MYYNIFPYRYAKEDLKITDALMEGWAKFTKPCLFKLSGLEGSHAFVYNDGQRAEWMKQIAEKMDQILLDEEYGC
jgi:surfactin synthase thioesterase subunit